MKAWLIGAGALGAVALVGCSGGATISPISIGKGDKFCTDVVAFQSQAAGLYAAATQTDLPTVKADVAVVQAALRNLATDVAKLPDKVNGHLVKDDLAVEVSTYDALASALAGANATSPTAVNDALATVQKAHGEALTSSTDRLDAYTSKVCGDVVSNATSTTVPGPTTTTTAVPATTVAGETTTTAAGTPTTAAPVLGPTVAPTTASPATAAP